MHLTSQKCQNNCFSLSKTNEILQKKNALDIIERDSTIYFPLKLANSFKKWHFENTKVTRTIHHRITDISKIKTYQNVPFQKTSFA